MCSASILGNWRLLCAYAQYLYIVDDLVVPGIKISFLIALYKLGTHRTRWLNLVFPASVGSH